MVGTGSLAIVLELSTKGLLKNAVSGVLIARRIRRTDLYASSSSRLAALLIAIFEQPLAIRQAFLK